MAKVGNTDDVRWVFEKASSKAALVLINYTTLDVFLFVISGTAVYQSIVMKVLKEKKPGSSEKSSVSLIFVVVSKFRKFHV